MSNNKWWTYLERVDPFYMDVDYLENFSSSEKHWLHSHLDAKKITYQFIFIDEKGIMGPPGISHVLPHTSARWTSSSIPCLSPPVKSDFETAIIEFVPRKGNMWTISKYKDDWFYCVQETRYDAEVFRCDGFKGLKKLLTELKLLK